MTKETPRRTVNAENFCATVEANVGNSKMSDREFREFVRDSLDIVDFPSLRRSLEEPTFMGGNNGSQLIRELGEVREWLGYPTPSIEEVTVAVTGKTCCQHMEAMGKIRERLGSLVESIPSHEKR